MKFFCHIGFHDFEAVTDKRTHRRQRVCLTCLRVEVEIEHHKAGMRNYYWIEKQKLARQRIRDAQLADKYFAEREERQRKARSLLEVQTSESKE